MSSFEDIPTRLLKAARSVALVLILAPGWVSGTPPALAETAKPSITKEQASESALHAVPGRVTDVTVERKLGKNVYVVEIVADQGGGEADVLVDMVSGNILGVER